MKKHFGILMLGIIAFTFAFTGCKKDDDDNDNNNNNTTAKFYFKATIGGEQVLLENGKNGVGSGAGSSGGSAGLGWEEEQSMQLTNFSFTKTAGASVI